MVWRYAGNPVSGPKSKNEEDLNVELQVLLSYVHLGERDMPCCTSLGWFLFALLR